MKKNITIGVLLLLFVSMTIYAQQQKVISDRHEATATEMSIKLEKQVAIAEQMAARAVDNEAKIVQALKKARLVELELQRCKDGD